MADCRHVSAGYGMHCISAACQSTWRTFLWQILQIFTSSFLGDSGSAYIHYGHQF